jgi:hypothetical protein
MGLKFGDISPVGALISGEGFASNFGAVPALRAKRIKAEEEQAKNMAAAEQAAEQANIQRQAQIAAQYGGGMKKGGKVKSASARADGCAIRGKTRA